jgi:hypothetical protein
MTHDQGRDTTRASLLEGFELAAADSARGYSNERFPGAGRGCRLLRDLKLVICRIEKCFH